jgi:uncharacterized membrane protein
MEAETTSSALPLIHSPEGVLAALATICAFWFFLEAKTRHKLFQIFPPLIFIYATPVLCNNLGLLPGDSPVYGVLRNYALPAFICLMLLSLDVGAAVRIMGRGVWVMLLGTFGVIAGGVISFLVVHRFLAEDAWQGFGALAGSWVGGTGNMAAVAGALKASPEQLGLAVLADNVIFVLWLPVLLGSKALADRFNRWAKVPPDRIAKMEQAAAQEAREERPATTRDYLYLACLATAATWCANALAERLPETKILSHSTWEVLLVTTFGIALSLTPARRLPGSHHLAMATVYIFVAGMGARASLSGLDQAPAFLLGALLWILIHGLTCVLGAKLLRVDIHTLAIASAANVGGAASAPVVAAAHRESLVPVSILMALIGYALGNYAGILVGNLCHWVSTL